MLQPKSIKKTQAYVFREYTWQDFFVLIIMTVLAAVFTSLVPSKYEIWLKPVVFIGTIILCSILLLKISKYDVRLYILLIRMFIFAFSTKKYKKSSGLIPYETIIDGKVVKTKILKHGTKYFAVLKFKGKIPWVEAEEDKEAFIRKFTGLLNNQDLQVSLIRLKERISYAKNIEYLKNQYKIKIRKLKNKNVNPKILNNYKKWYEEKLLDFKAFEKEQYIDNYYLVVYENKLDALEYALNQSKVFLNLMETEPERLEEMNLIKFLANYHGKKLDLSKAEKYLEQLDKAKNDTNNQAKKEAQIEVQNELETNQIKLTNVTETITFMINKLKKIPQSKTIETQIRLDELLSDELVHFKHNYFIKGNEKYCSVQYVSQLPTRLSQNWADSLLSNNSKIIWSLNKISDDNIATIFDKTKQRLSDNNDSTHSHFSKTSNNIQDQAFDYLRDQVIIEKNNLFNSYFLIFNEANSLKELREIERKNTFLAKKNQTDLITFGYRQFQAYAQTCLITTDNLKEAIQMTSSNAAYGWAFKNEFHNDGNLAIMGRTIITGEPIIVNRFYKKNNRRTNYNWMTIGSSGKGKSSYKSKSIVDALAENHNVYVIDLEGEYENLAEKFGGTIFHLGSDSGASLNPLEIRISLWDDKTTNTSKKDILLQSINKHCEWLDGFFRLVNKKYDDEQIMIIMNSVKKVYEGLGIYDLRSINDLKNIEWPTISDLIKQLDKFEFKSEVERNVKENDILKISDMLRYLFEENGKFEKLYNRQTNIELNNNFIVFNTKELMSLGKDENSIGTYVLLSLIQNLVYQNIIINKNTHTVLFVDEIHQYIDVNKPIMLDFFFKLAKTGRKYLLSLDLTTQSPSDLLVNKKAESIVQNCQYSNIFGLKSKDLNAVETMYEYAGGLNKSITEFLNDGVIGNNMISLHLSSKIKISTWYNNYEKLMYFKHGDFKKQ